MDIEFLLKNSEGDDPHIKFVRSDILLQAASEEDLKYMDTYLHLEHGITLFDIINRVHGHWIYIGETKLTQELGWKFLTSWNWMTP